MLKDRRVLLEQEIKKAHDQAANMYLSIAVGGATGFDEDYQTLKNHVMDLQFELDMVNKLILKGHT